tara:strand:+ start:1038 stop:1550 length:513 start_codon:yes stop_codon:yes gene_type:complete
MFSLERAWDKVTSVAREKWDHYSQVFTNLPGESQTWLFLTGGLFAFTWLVGGPIFNASFMALVCCGALWALAVEYAPWGRFFCNLGVKGDAAFTFLTFFCAGATVGGMWSVFFMGVYFTFIRRFLSPHMDSYHETWVSEEEEKARKRAEEEAQTDDGGCSPPDGGEPCLA